MKNKFIQKGEPLSWDSFPLLGLIMEDMDDNAINYFREQSAKRGLIKPELLKKSNEMLFRELDLIVEDCITNAAMLLFSKKTQYWHPESSIEIYFYNDEAWVLSRDEITGPITTLVDKAIEVLHSKYLKPQISYINGKKTEKYFVPEAALRETIINALCHTDYTKHKSVQVDVFEKKMYINNVGQIANNYSVDKLLKKGERNYINPVIANIFYLMGEIDGSGSGLSKIFTICKNENVPEPSFRINGNKITMRFTASKDFNPSK